MKFIGIKVANENICSTFAGKFKTVLIITYYVLDFGISIETRRRPLACHQEMEDEGEIYECIEDIWPDYPSKEDFFFNEEEY